jgi:FkbM family methyltransferase
LKLHRFDRSIHGRHLVGEYESFLQQVIIAELGAHPNGTFFDVGANAGFLSLVAAKALNGKGRVVAFEPHPQTASEAQRQFQLNNLTNVTVVAAAVSNDAGFVELDDSGSSDMVKFAQLEKDRPRHKVRVPTVTLDEQVDKFGMPDVVKIDIEGAEMLALQGAKRMLGAGNATLLVEIHSEELYAEIQPYLKSFGYRFFRISGKEITDNAYVRFVIAKKTGIPAATGVVAAAAE